MYHLPQVKTIKNFLSVPECKLEYDSSIHVTSPEEPNLIKKFRETLKIKEWRPWVVSSLELDLPAYDTQWHQDNSKLPYWVGLILLSNDTALNGGQVQFLHKRGTKIVSRILQTGNLIYFDDSTMFHRRTPCSLLPGRGGINVRRLLNLKVRKF